jgi:ferredoxin
MKIRVIEERCQGQGMCRMAAPEIFELRDLDGHATVRTSEVSGALAEKAKLAAQTCPEFAIRLEALKGDGEEL